MRASAPPHPTSEPTAQARGAVSVVVPFAGDRARAERVVESLARLRLAPSDEIVIADNSPVPVVHELALPPQCHVVPAESEGSPARARNAGALAAHGEWLLFIDSDCRPAPGLIEAYFATAIPEDCGLVAGAVASEDTSQSSLAADFARTRGILSQQTGIGHPFLSWALTANLLVRAETWRRLGGFLDGIYNGEDVDFCWRAQRAGWTLEFNPRAEVGHFDRETVGGLFRQAAIHRASARWIARRWPDAPRPSLGVLRSAARTAVAAPVFLLMGQRRRAALKLLDAAVPLAALRGDLRPNRALPRPVPAGTRRPVQIWCDEFPVISETFVVAEARELQRLGHVVEVVATRRPDRPALGVHDVRARWLEDDTRVERAVALVKLLVRRPLACLRDAAAWRRWAAEETVTPLRILAPAVLRALREPELLLHAHFAGVASLNAMRVAHLAGRPWTLTAHAYDIYKLPRNLREKLRDAALVTSGCDYTVRDLRRIAGAGHDDHIVRIVMGVDPERFRRRREYPGGRTVLAVGRLVEKKGFVHLVRALADPPLAGRVDRLVIVGEGPLHAELAAEARSLGLDGVLQFAGRLEPEEIQALLESADLLAMPCVVAEDGDRDSMPVVVKEALAMEVPVVVSDEVGLPELVRPEFGRAVPPGDAPALAAALAELLELPAERRAEMGRAGRAFVAEHANVRTETARLSELLERVGRPSA